ncbi:MAG TPA: dihydropteroate synthase [Marisediminicola sp.]|nr:dihydropteroate synthase [Marisediminicola sp.]
MTDLRTSQLSSAAAPSRLEKTPEGAARGLGRPMILGILNVTPDSFSDGGTHLNTASAIEFATRLHESGADIVDVGGESTRPGAERLPVEEEQRRVLPVIEELAKRGVPLSVDTMNARTAAAAAALGVGIINDVSGGTADPDMPKTIADSGVMFIAMHSRGSSATMDSRAIYRDTVRDVRTELERCVANLIGQGVRADRIIVDPGIGFAKNAGQNWELLAGLRELRALGHPVLVGASRKRFLADLLPVDSHPGDRDAATAVISALAAEAGVWGVRVHDVDSTKAALDVWSAMNGARK